MSSKPTNVKDKLEKVRASETALDPITQNTIAGEETIDDMALPSGGSVTVREMTGYEEDILTNRKHARSRKSMDLVMQACIESLNGKAKVTENDVLDLWSGDRMFILYMIRKLSYGAKFNLPITCPECRETTRVQGDMDKDLSVINYPDGAKDIFEFTMPKSGDKIIFKHMDGHQERRVMKMENPSMTDLLGMQIASVNGQSLARPMMLKWSAGDRTALRDEMARVAGGIDLAEELYCGRCGAPIPARLETLQGFLLPTRSRIRV